MQMPKKLAKQKDFGASLTLNATEYQGKELKAIISFAKEQGLRDRMENF